MSSPSSDILDAVVWLILPGSSYKNEEEIKEWLQQENVTGWINALKAGSRTTLQIRCIVIFSDNPTDKEALQSKARAALRSVFDITDVSFENDSCLRGKKRQLGESSCDLLKDSRDHQVYRLLLVDEQGNGFPCYGAWEAFRNDESDFPNQGTLIWAYRNGNFRSLCRECVNGHPESNWEIFPCSRCGCQVWPTVWGGAREYHHLQFTGRDGRWCPSFKPDFEISLEQSRSRLEKLLFEDEFWRRAFIEDRTPLDRFWPDDPSSDGNIIPLYLSGPDQDRYKFFDDTPSSLDNYPPTNYFPPISPEHDQDIIPELQQRFLPICFLPHLRVLFKLTDKIILLSVILTDPFTNTDFNYRSIYRNGSGQPGCFVDDAWKSLWRLPNSWGKWKKIVLNLSSSIRKEVRRDGQILHEPQEYVLKLSRKAYFSHSYGKEKLDLTGIWQNDIGNLRSRATILRSRAPMLREFANKNTEPEDNCFEDVFLSDSNAEHKSLGEEVWAIVSKLSEKSCFYIRKNMNGWEPCSDGMPAGQEATFGCSLLNYLIWVCAIFGDDICAIETFNSINLSNNKPSQFVVFTSSPLNQADRARLKLTISTLLQPIENAYAILTETINETNKLHLERKDAEIAAKKSAIRHYGHTMGHRISPVVAHFEGQDSTTEAASCARLVHDMTLILQAYAVQNQEEFFRLNTEKGERFVDYDTPLDLLSLLEREIRNISAKGVQMSHGILYRFPVFEIHARKAVVALTLRDTLTDRLCRLKTAFFTQLLSELVINAVNHGWHFQSDEEDGGKRAGVIIGVDAITLYNQPALVLTNHYSADAKPAPAFFSTKWKLWPKDRENDGPGMALSVFEAIQAGKMMLKVDPPIPEQNEPGLIHVALLLNGLMI